MILGFHSEFVMDSQYIWRIHNTNGGYKHRSNERGNGMKGIRMLPMLPRYIRFHFYIWLKVII